MMLCNTNELSACCFDIAHRMRLVLCDSLSTDQSLPVTAQSVILTLILSFYNMYHNYTNETRVTVLGVMHLVQLTSVLITSIIIHS